MNKNNFLKIFSLSILLLPLHIHASEGENIEPITAYANEQESMDPAKTEQSYWRQYAPQALQDAGDYAASFVPKSIKDRVNSWSTATKVRMLGALLASLLAIYNRDKVIDLVNMFTTDYGVWPSFAYNPNDPISVKEAEDFAQKLLIRIPQSSAALKQFYLSTQSSAYPKGSIGDKAMELVRKRLPGENIPANTNPHTPMQGIRVSREDILTRTYSKNK